MILKRFLMKTTRDTRDSSGNIEDDWHDLLSASYFGDIGEIKYLLDIKGIDVNYTPEDSKGVTALIAASINGHTEVAKFLIERGAQVNMKAIQLH